MKGYSPFIKVKPGRVKITFNLTWPSWEHGLGAAGGVVAANADLQNTTSFTATVEKGKAYIVVCDRIENKRDISVKLEEYVHTVK